MTDKEEIEINFFFYLTIIMQIIIVTLITFLSVTGLHHIIKENSYCTIKIYGYDQSTPQQKYTIPYNQLGTIVPAKKGFLNIITTYDIREERTAMNYTKTYGRREIQCKIKFNT